MKENQREKGAYWEQKAGAYLESIGYEILEYNFRCRMGEIDIIAQDGEYLVFCEVKYRAGQERVIRRKLSIKENSVLSLNVRFII